MTETQTPEEVAALLRSSYGGALSGIIAIDGKDGAGKSYLAETLRNLIGGAVVSLDSFLRQKYQGGYVPYLNLAAIGAAIEGCAKPKIIEGCCVLEVLESVACKQDVLIYVKKVVFYPQYGHYWIHQDILDLTEPIDEAIRGKDSLTKEFILYHDKYKPLRHAQIAFLNKGKKPQ
jgi:hypothetical protein